MAFNSWCCVVINTHCCCVLLKQECTVVKLKQVLWESPLCDTFVHHTSIVHVTDLHLCLMSFLCLNISAKLCNLSHLTELQSKNALAMPKLSRCPKQYHTSWDQLWYVNAIHAGLCTCSVARKAIIDVMHRVKSHVHWSSDAQWTFYEKLSFSHNEVQVKGVKLSRIWFVVECVCVFFPPFFLLLLSSFPKITKCWKYV